MAERVQRLLITYGCDDAVKYISHLDLMRLWERVLRRAQVPVLYSEGFSPRPRIAMAAPLPVGVSSQAEKLDMLLGQRVKLDEVRAVLEPQLPNGLSISTIEELPLKVPSLQSLTRAAVYEVRVEDGRSRDAWQQAISDLLALESLPWEHQRGDDLKRYDLRPLIHSIDLIECGDGKAHLKMRLRNDSGGSGRPEQVTRALAVNEEPLRMHRLELELDIPSLARDAIRRAGYEAR